MRLHTLKNIQKATVATKIKFYGRTHIFTCLRNMEYLFRHVSDVTRATTSERHPVHFAVNEIEC